MRMRKESAPSGVDGKFTRDKSTKREADRTPFRARRKRGAAIAETGPALFLLLIIIFFPMLDLLEMGAAYVFASIYHDYMIRELAIRTPEANGNAAAKAKIDTEFRSSGFFSFLKMTNDDMKVDSVEYLPNMTNPTQIQVATSVTVRPFINIPFFSTVPGLGAPVVFKLASQRPQEEKGRD
jgi:hypothetical protein